MTALDDLKREVTELQTKLETLRKRVVIVGTIVPYGGESEPGDGWLLCDGRPLDRGVYPDLYHAIGANFGAPDETHFNLPDLRGRFVRGVDHAAERDPDARKRTFAAPGGSIGDKVGSLQDDAFKAHTHTYDMFPGDSGNRARGSCWKEKKIDTGSTGGSETRPKNVYVNYIIKY